MSKKPASGIELKTKAEKCLRQITTKRNIYAPAPAFGRPEDTDRKKEVIDDITGCFDTDILNQIKEAIKDSSCLLLIGNKDKSILAACYAHCIRDINLSNFKNTYIKYSDHLREHSKYNRLKIYLPEISKYSFFEYKSCFGESMFPFGDDVKEWMDWLGYGYSLFLHRLKLKRDEYGYDDTCNNFIRSLGTTRSNMPKGSSELFIISIDNESDLPDNLRDEFVSIMLDDEETVKTSADGKKLEHEGERVFLVKGKEGKLKRGEKQQYVPEEELLPFLKQDLEYLRSDKGGALKGGSLAKRIQGDIYKRFNKVYGKKADYKVATIRNMISEINTGKK